MCAEIQPECVWVWGVTMRIIESMKIMGYKWTKAQRNYYDIIALLRLLLPLFCNKFVCSC